MRCNVLELAAFRARFVSQLKPLEISIERGKVKEGFAANEFEAHMLLRRDFNRCEWAASHSRGDAQIDSTPLCSARGLRPLLQRLVAVGSADRLGHRPPDRQGQHHHELDPHESFAARWQKESLEGDHYRLAFDQPNTWSQKYNLIWDRFTRAPFLSARSHASRKWTSYTKLDWTVWTASLTGDKGDFEALVTPVVHFLNRSSNRVPMRDWYYVNDAKQAGFQARPVVGGVFIRLLDDPAVWKKWSTHGRTKAAG